MKMLTLTIATGLLTAGCGRDLPDPPTPWLFEEAPDEGTEAPEPDSTPEPPSEPSTAPDEACTDPELHLLVADRRSSEPFKWIDVADGRTFMSVVGPSGEGLDVAEWVLDDASSDGLVRLDPQPGVQIPVGTSDQKLWTIGEGVVRSYSLREDGATAAFEAPGITPTAPVAFAASRQYVASGLLGWVTDGTLRLFDDGVPTFQVAGAHPGIWVSDGGVAWATRDGAEIHFTDRSGADRSRSRSDGLPAWPVILDSTLLYIDAGEVWAWDLETDDVEPVLQYGSCGPLHTDGTTAVTACDSWRESTPDPDYETLAAEQVWSIDFETLQPERVEASRAEVMNPVVSERWIVWLEHEPTFTLTDRPNEDEDDRIGKVVIWSREAERTVEDPWVGRGCWNCEDAESVWPPPLLDVGGDTVAFNYARGGTSSHSGHVGLMRLPAAGCGPPDADEDFDAPPSDPPDPNRP